MKYEIGMIVRKLSNGVCGQITRIIPGSELNREEEYLYLFSTGFGFDCYCREDEIENV